ncbi:hypothetical protein K1T71_008873 [Dendrolimus kikuchii]|uniref:Uncharacterized protein n=1 Tax=Dendrolimus kikuchii TaxID=765133 RepID=A0ACC1CVJ3_9NEOP|nr:hypothetical protein K1T71_008873 [Dendrolimus kikuchii]
MHFQDDDSQTDEIKSFSEYEDEIDAPEIEIMDPQMTTDAIQQNPIIESSSQRPRRETKPPIWLEDFDTDEYLTGQGYGPFTVIVAGNKDCKGPRKRECGVLNTTLVDNTTVHYDFDLRENVAPFQHHCRRYTLQVLFHKITNRNIICFATKERLIASTPVLRATTGALRTISSSEIKYAETCRGPKRKDCANMKLHTNGKLLLHFEVEVTQNVILNHGRMVATSSTKETIKYQMKKPCDHMLLKSLLQYYMNVTEDCKLLKGHYVMSVDVAAVNNKYYYESYMVGNWTFKTVMYAQISNTTRLLIGVVFLFFIFHTLSKKAGSFDLLVTKFEYCKGPKRRDCSHAIVKLNNNSIISFDLTVEENTTPTKGKIIAISNGKEFLRLQMKKPCDHLFMRPLLQQLMNVTQDCVIVKGHYKFKVDIQDIAQKYYAGSFLYGNWTFKSMFYNEECNFSCAVVEVLLSPKTKTTTH